MGKALESEMGFILLVIVFYITFLISVCLYNKNDCLDSYLPRKWDGYCYELREGEWVNMGKSIRVDVEYNEAALREIR